jgi:hypothetical protein
MKIASRPFEHVPQFKYLGTTVTNQNLDQEIHFWGRLLPLSPEHFVFSSAVKRLRN